MRTKKEKLWLFYYTTHSGYMYKYIINARYMKEPKRSKEWKLLKKAFPYVISIGIEDIDIFHPIPSKKAIDLNLKMLNLKIKKQ